VGRYTAQGVMRLISIILLLYLSLAYWSNPMEPSPEMSKMATDTVKNYLKQHELPYERVTMSIPKDTSISDFELLYTDGGRCIHFIVKCHGRSCTELQWYPFDRHGEKCPITSH